MNAIRKGEASENDIILSDFFFELPSRGRAVFSKTSLLDRQKVLSINHTWDQRELGREKIHIIKWHIDSTDNNASHYIDLLIEAEETGMLDKVLDVLEYAYMNRLVCSIEHVYRAVEMEAEEGFPIELTVNLVVDKSASDIEAELAKKLEFKKRIEENARRKLSLEELEARWQESQSQES